MSDWWVLDHGRLFDYDVQILTWISQGIWAGGDPDQPKGVIEWAGGITDYQDVYNMYVKSVNVTDFGTGKEYVYSDRSGSWQSIKAVQ